MKKIQVKSVVVCDDIRTEKSGKHILIGVYNDIGVLKFPTQLVLAFWVQFFCRDGASKIPCTLRLRGDHDEEFFKFEFTLEAPKTGLASIGFGGIPVALQILGTLHLQFREEEGEWETILDVPVTLHPQPPSST
jgi:uncharacterized protein DUF6941